MKKKLGAAAAAALIFSVGIYAALAFATGETTGTVTAVVSDRVVTIPGQTVIETYTIPTVTVTMTVETEPPPPPPPPPPQTGLYPFRAGESVWTTAWDSPVVDPNSSAKIAYFVAHQILSPNMAIRSWSVAVAETDGTDPLFSVACTTYYCPYLTSENPIPIPGGTRPDPAGDGSLALWNSSTHQEYDFWRSRCPNDCAHTASGDSLSTDGDGKSNVPGSAGALASGLPFLGGLVRPEEIQAGRIDHALELIVPNAGTGYRCPASHSDGTNGDPAAVNEGTLLQLNPSLDVDALSIPDWEKVLAHALQDYGAYVVDKGGSLNIRAENPVNRLVDLWAQLGLSGNSVPLQNFPWSSLRVLTPPAPYC